MDNFIFDINKIDNIIANIKTNSNMSFNTIYNAFLCKLYEINNNIHTVDTYRYNKEKPLEFIETGDFFKYIKTVNEFIFTIYSNLVIAYNIIDYIKNANGNSNDDNDDDNNDNNDDNDDNDDYEIRKCSSNKITSSLNTKKEDDFNKFVKYLNKNNKEFWVEYIKSIYHEMNNKMNNKINKINKNHLINPYYYFNCYIYIDEYDKTQKIYQKTNIMNYLLYLKQHLSSLHQEEHIKTYVAKNYFTIPVNDKINNDNYKKNLTILYATIFGNSYAINKDNTNNELYRLLIDIRNNNKTDKFDEEKYKKISNLINNSNNIIYDNNFMVEIYKTHFQKNTVYLYINSNKIYTKMNFKLNIDILIIEEVDNINNLKELTADDKFIIKFISSTILDIKIDGISYLLNNVYIKCNNNKLIAGILKDNKKYIYNTYSNIFEYTNYKTYNIPFPIYEFDWLNNYNKNYYISNNKIFELKDDEIYKNAYLMEDNISFKTTNYIYVYNKS
jgi:hypothetical protein